MKIVFLIISTLILSACASNIKFEGKSLADPVLKADILRHIALIERTAYDCNSISSINTEVVKTDITGNAAQPLIVDEIWTINACGKARNYPVNMRQDAKGETDFTVTVVGNDIQNNNKNIGK